MLAIDPATRARTCSRFPPGRERSPVNLFLSPSHTLAVPSAKPFAFTQNIANETALFLP